MPRLVNEEIDELVTRLTDYQSSLSEAVYEQFKASTVLSKSINLKGKTGDSMKDYMGIVHINLTQKVINVSAELLEAARKMRDDFLDFESDAGGIVGSGTLDEEKDKLKKNRERFEDHDAEGQRLVQRAQEFISIVRLPTETVQSTYDTADRNVKKTKEKLFETDAQCTKRIEPVTQRINELLTEMTELSEHFKNKNGVIADKVSSIKEQPWYSLENKGAFEKMAEDDPFSYSAGEASLLEGQWKMGTSGSNYIASTGTVLSASGEVKNDNGAFTASGEFSGAKMYSEGETLGGWIKGNSEQSVLGGSGTAEFDGFTKMAASGEVSVLKADATAMIGTDNFNGHVTGKFSALSANGQAAFKLPDNADEGTHIALGGRAEAVTLKADLGFTLFGMDKMGGSYKDEHGKVKKGQDFGLNFQPSIGLQAGAGVEYKSDPVWKSDYMNLNATKVGVDLKLGIGIKFDVTVPTLTLKWPW